MRLGKLGYYGDFLVYPLIVVILGVALVRRNTAGHQTGWAACVLGGAALWTLLEYLIHRTFLHRGGVFTVMHAEHHAFPRAYIGTPAWISVPTFTLLVAAPAWLRGGGNVAGGLTGGIMLGYWWYGVVHHVIHHRTALPFARYFSRLRRHHQLHHHSAIGGNFGVTTVMWDVLLGTTIAAPITPRSAPQARHPKI